MTMDEIRTLESQAAKQSELFMEHLRKMPWMLRERVCASLTANDEFCWSCGMDTPGGFRCQCDNDE